MCVTHAYRCPECGRCKSVPRIRSSVARYLCEWARIGVILGDDIRQPLVDKMCDNRYCMRRNDGGYSVCVPMEDPCFFCIRYGVSDLCYNQYVSLVCLRCHEAGFERKKKELEKKGGVVADDKAPPYPRCPPHYRTQRLLDKDEDPRVAAAEQVARDTMHHKDGLLKLSLATRLANTAVLAGTHK